MNRSCAGFYHDPPIWAGSSPIDWTKSQDPDFDAFRQEVFRQKLDGIAEVRVTCEGLFAFDFTGWSPGTFPEEKDNQPAPFELSAEAILNRTLVMNAFLMFLYTAVFEDSKFMMERMVVTPELVISLDSLNDDSGMGFGNSRVSHLALSSFRSTYRSGLPFAMDDRIMTRHLVSLRAVEQAMLGLDGFLKQGTDDGLLLSDLCLRASKAYQDHNYSLALITNWAVIEQLLQATWRRYQEDNSSRDGKKFIDGPRKTRLRDGRTFSSAVIAEMLSFAGYIGHDNYTDLTMVRKSRNDWIHGLKKTTVADAQLSGSLCDKLMLEVKGVKVTNLTGLRIHG